MELISDKVFTLILRTLDTIEANMARIECAMRNKKEDCTTDFRELYKQIKDLRDEVVELSKSMTNVDHNHELDIQALKLMAKDIGGKSGRDMGALSALIVAIIYGLLQKFGIL